MHDRPPWAADKWLLICLKLCRFFFKCQIEKYEVTEQKSQHWASVCTGTPHRDATTTWISCDAGMSPRQWCPQGKPANFPLLHSVSQYFSHSITQSLSISLFSSLVFFFLLTHFTCFLCLSDTLTLSHAHCCKVQWWIRWILISHCKATCPLSGWTVRDTDRHREVLKH